jgi:uncharacterized protein YqeY
VTVDLKSRLDADLKAAMKAGEALRRDTLRMVIAAVKNRANQVKTRTDSAQQYDAAGRADLADKERAEIEVLQGYLPQQLSEAETRAAVEKAIADTGASSKADLGKVIKAVMAAHKGQVDGKQVQRLIAELLS